MAAFLLSQLDIGDIGISLQESHDNVGGVVSVSKVNGAFRIDLTNYSGAIYLKPKEKQVHVMQPLPVYASSRTQSEERRLQIDASAEDPSCTGNEESRQTTFRTRVSSISDTSLQQNEASHRSDNIYQTVTNPTLSELPSPREPTNEEYPTAYSNSTNDVMDDESPSECINAKITFNDTAPSSPGTQHDSPDMGQEEATPSGRRGRRRQGILGSSLHDKCRKPNVTLDELRESLAEEPLAASQPDVTGRLPLHILGENEALLSTRHGREDATSFCLELMDAYPDGIVASDNFGRFPFTNMVLEWVFVATERLGLDDQDSETMENFLNLFRRHRREKMSPFHSIMSQFSTATPHALEFNPATAISESILVDVVVGPILEWSFVMLSTSFDHCCGRFRKSGGGMRSRARTVGSELAKHIASIPLLFRTMLLIEDEEVRNRLLHLPIIRRTALRTESVGPWLVAMLRKQGIKSHRVVDHFEMISSIGVKDLIGCYMTPRSEDFILLLEERETTYDAIENLGHIIPSLIVLSDMEVERAASTDIVWRTIARASSRPFSVGIVLIDFVSHVTLIMSVRVMVFWRPGIKGFDTVPTFELEEFPVIVIFAISIQFLLRKIAETISLASISHRVVRSSVFNFWSLLDFTAIACAMSLAAVHSMVRIYQYEYLQLFTIALQWLKLLAFLRGINAELATFILSIVQIGYNVRWFMLIVLIVIVTFGDLMHFVAVKFDTGLICTGENDLAVTDFCTSFFRSYLRMWTVLLGDFNMHTYQEHPAFQTLWFLFTVIGFIVLLNVLIAVVSDSYEKSRILSTRLYGRARVDFAVSHLALEEALSVTSNRFEGFGGHIFHIFSLSLLISLLLTAIFTLTYLCRLVMGDVLVFSLGSRIVGVVCAILLIIALCIFLQQMLGENFGNTIGTLPIIAPVWKLFSACCRGIVKFVAETVLGVNLMSNMTGDHSKDVMRDGKVLFLVKSLKSAVESSERNITSAVKAVEKHLKYHESRLADELKDEIAEKFF